MRVGKNRKGSLIKNMRNPTPKNHHFSVDLKEKFQLEPIHPNRSHHKQGEINSYSTQKPKSFSKGIEIHQYLDKISRTIRKKTIRSNTDYSRVPSHVVRKSLQKSGYTLKTLSKDPEVKDETISVFTEFEKKQMKMYEILFAGKRRIEASDDFTLKNGTVNACIGDSIIYRYEILSQLNRGTFGQVFKAYDHKKNEVVALKIIRNQPKFQKQARVEISLLEEVLNNKNYTTNIVCLKHAFMFRGHFCLSFQLLFMNLFQLSKSVNFVGLPLNLIHQLAIQILQGLNFLQKRHIIHCDIKPENIMIKRENKAGLKIIDLGSGCFEGKQIYNYIQSLYYRSPEIILGVQYTSAIDIWSFGCVIVELFLGYPLFSGSNQTEQIALFTELLGEPELQFLGRGNRSYKFFNNTKLINATVKGKHRNPLGKPLKKVLEKCVDKKFVDFVSKCLTWVPQERIKASEALLDDWIISGLPQEIRSQHVKAAQVA